MEENKVPARKEIKVGQRVWAVEVRNYATGELTKGTVKHILTRKPHHPRGIKVMFKDGTIARVQRLTPPEKEAITRKDLPTEEDLI